jgi:hypothetical protein
MHARLVRQLLGASRPSELRPGRLEDLPGRKRPCASAVACPVVQEPVDLECEGRRPWGGPGGRLDGPQDMVSVTGPDSSWCLRVGDPQSSLRSASTPFMRPTKVPVRLCSRLGQKFLLRLSVCLIASYPRPRSNCRLRPFVVPRWRVWEGLRESQRSKGQSRTSQRGYQESIALSRGCEGIASLSRRRSECVNRQWSGSGCPATPQRATTVDRYTGSSDPSRRGRSGVAIVNW